MNCLRCGRTLVGRQEKFCSDPCRKRHHESQTVGRCSGCGAPASRIQTRQRQGTLCRACSDAAKHRRWERRALAIADMWAAGLSLTEIGERLGWTVAQTGVEFARIRKWRPELLPYRYPRERVANATAGWARALERRKAAS